ncbi:MULTISPECIES: hypothetical protein [Spirosoma]|uniref:DUF3244 domain-containing protein n=1 Tax=Spirosoma liriopis TaxID=2937440 RepID=A0ABT0HS53_9BACT|nr:MULTISPECIES: hypothetical protein [Spirosoma]MCK8495006.1 hypothetical protein [Spirosoma liriopis]UHG94095.1 hypothetical protein LQ777_25485 [Spirosoma oryzicola]
MKKIFILMAGLVASSASFAKTSEPTKPHVTTSLIGQEKLRLIVAPEKATATISLRDDKGHVLYSGNVNLRDGVQQKFDISNLEEGQYQLSVAVGKERTLKAFTITDLPSQQSVTIQE